MIGELFDPKADLIINEHFRPHWSQAGAIVFITFRTHDSLPREVITRWEREKQEWMIRRGHREHWSKGLLTMSFDEQKEFRRHFDHQREASLDTCHGQCVLRDPALARIVANTLMHFDRVRYCMGDFVIMPNHVHLLASFPTEEAMKKQCSSWLHYSATEINRRLGRKGKFWQQEPFDHLVRSIRQYEYLRKYIAENPVKAHLAAGEYYYRRHQP